jgi:hypothetical protein
MAESSQAGGGLRKPTMNPVDLLGPYATVAQLGATVLIGTLLAYLITYSIPSLFREFRDASTEARKDVIASHQETQNCVTKCIGDFRAELQAERDWRERDRGRLQDRIDGLECQRPRVAAGQRPPAA